MQTIQACITRRTWATLKELEGQEAKDCAVYWYDAPSGSPQVSSFAIKTEQGWYEIYQDYQLLQDEGEYAFLMCQKRAPEEGKEGYTPAHAIYSATKPGGERVFLTPASLQLTGPITNVTLVRDELEIKQGEKEPWHLSADIAVRLDIAGSTIAIEADDTDVWCVRYRRFGESLEDFPVHWRFKIESPEEIVSSERNEYLLTGEVPPLTLPPKPTPEPREPKSVPAAGNRAPQGGRGPRPQPSERGDRGPRPQGPRGQAPRGDRPPRASQPGERPARPVQPGERAPRPVQPGERQARPVQPGERAPRPVQPGERQARPVQPGERAPRPVQPGAQQNAPQRTGEQPRTDRSPRGGSSRRGPRPPRDARESAPQSGTPRPPRPPRDPNRARPRPERPAGESAPSAAPAAPNSDK